MPLKKLPKEIILSNQEKVSKDYLIPLKLIDIN